MATDSLPVTLPIASYVGWSIVGDEWSTAPPVMLVVFVSNPDACTPAMPAPRPTPTPTVKPVSLPEVSTPTLPSASTPRPYESLWPVNTPSALLFE